MRLPTPLILVIICLCPHPALTQVQVSRNYKYQIVKIEAIFRVRSVFRHLRTVVRRGRLLLLLSLEASL